MFFFYFVFEGCFLGQRRVISSWNFDLFKVLTPSRVQKRRATHTPLCNTLSFNPGSQKVKEKKIFK